MAPVGIRRSNLKPPSAHEIRLAQKKLRKEIVAYRALLPQSITLEKEVKFVIPAQSTANVKQFYDRDFHRHKMADQTTTMTMIDTNNPHFSVLLSSPVSTVKRLKLEEIVFPHHDRDHNVLSHNPLKLQNKA
jgi:hypothetical protein